MNVETDWEARAYELEKALNYEREINQITKMELGRVERLLEAKRKEVASMEKQSDHFKNRLLALLKGLSDVKDRDCATIVRDQPLP